jgi:DNA-binding NtrC family response regulator/tetratricopeptide (TPR) repeat protein
MHRARGLNLEAAMQLLRTGRFSEAVKTLEVHQYPVIGARGASSIAQAILADALQRTGENLRAQRIASCNLEVSSLPPDARARCHFVLGNVCRENGDIADAIDHFQIAAGIESSDLELCCWIQLRLMISIAEQQGIRPAMARLDGVRRALTKYGDPRPFAVLHLWMVEIESTRGNLASARRHLKTARSLLAQIDDAWLQGYLAINSSGVSYYCAEIDEARRWADLAIEYAQTSGHRGARRAAYANIGQIEFSAGNLGQSEEYFARALACCEQGSSHKVAILDSLARIKLNTGDLQACKAILKKIDELGQPSNPKTSYCSWPLQTKVQLLLKEGRARDARCLSQVFSRSEVETPQSRTTTVSNLLVTEALLADGNLNGAASSLSAVVSPRVQVAPDLFAEKERIVGGILRASQAEVLAKIHLERALVTFDKIGHCLGKERVLAEIDALPNSLSENTAEIAFKRALSRISALLDTRTQPELFRREAVLFLSELGCAESISFDCNVSALSLTEGIEWQDDPKLPPPLLSLELTHDEANKIVLNYVPRREPASMISALHFHRVVTQLMSLDDNGSTVDECDIVWASDNRSSSGATVFAAESMLSILRTVRKIAPTDVSVLITGETGTRKEVIARRIHEQSTRSSMPFSALNCAAIPKELIESQLFGYKKGAFSGATDGFQGVIRGSNGGTLLLDEIGEIPMDVQAKLLRFLEQGEVHAIGEAQPSKVNVRLMFATNSDLEEAVRQNTFRKDLFYRMNVVPIKLPPLRDRREEIPLLVRLFSQRFASEFLKEPIRFSDAALEFLIFHEWPGNVRQLANEVRRLAVLLDSGAYVTPQDLCQELRSTNVEKHLDLGHPNLAVRLDQSLEQAVTCLEREMIDRALKEAGGHVTIAASNLGLSRKGLYLKRRRLGMVES